MYNLNIIQYSVMTFYCVKCIIHLTLSSMFGCRLPMMADGKTVNDRYMPTIGNGHIAATAFANGIFMDGFYSGVGCKQDTKWTIRTVSTYHSSVEDFLD